MSERRTVAVTGMGVVSPIGTSVEEFGQALFSCRSGAGPITRFDPGELPTRIAAEVRTLPFHYRDVKIDFALHAARQAMSQAFGPGILPGKVRAGLSIGLGLELFSMDDLTRLRSPAFERPKSRQDALTFLNTPSDLCVHLIAREHGLNRPPQIHISACAAGTDAIGGAWRAISEGKLDVALAGGTDSMINPMGVAGFCRITAMTTRNDEPHRASRPFDRDRAGFLLGEGAAFLVLEERESALRRGARILATISGFGGSLDGYSVSDPHPEGAGALAAMLEALRAAGLSPEDISAVSAHGTGTPKNDPVESTAIRALLGERAMEVPVMSTKSMIGHCISAAGAIESVASIISLREQRIHPTLNLDEPAPDCQLRHVRGAPLSIPLKHILKNSFGFGGMNACIVISKESP